MQASTKMFRTCLQNRIVQKKYSSTFEIYKCYLCHAELSDEFGSVLDHINSNEHMVKMNQIDQSVEETESEILSHIPHWKQKKIVESCVTIGCEPPPTFFCHICNCKVSDSSVIDHTDSILHKERWIQEANVANKSKSMNPNVKHELPEVVKACTSPNSNGCFSNVSAKLDSHMRCISTIKNLYFCDICSCSIQGARCTWDHFSGKRHRASIKATEVVKIETSDTEKFTREDLLFLVRIGSVIDDICFCTLCKVYLKDPLMVQCHVMLHLHQEIDFPSFVDIVEFSSSQSGTLSITCLLCEFSSTDSSHVYDHLKSPKHSNNLKIFSQLKDDVVSKSTSNTTIDTKSLKFHHDEDIVKAFFCNACNKPLSGILQNVDQHKIEEQHRENVVEYMKVKSEVCSNPPPINYSRLYVCFVCNLSFFTPGRLLEHQNERDHKCRMGNFKTIHQDPAISFTVLNRKPLFNCVPCNDKFLSLKKTVEHVLADKHGMKLLNSNQESRLITGNTIGSCVNRIEQSNVSMLTSGNITKTYFGSKKDQQKTGDIDIQNKISKPSKQTKSTQTSTHVCKYPFLPENIIPASREELIDYCIDLGKMDMNSIDAELIRLLSVGLELTVSHNSKRYCFVCQITLSTDQPTLFAHLQSPLHILNFCDLKIKNQKRDEPSNSFSNLELAKLCIEKVSDHLVYCYLCNMEISHNYEHIVLHYKTAKHVRKSLDHYKETDNLHKQFLMIYKNAWYYTESFACKICKREYISDIEFVKHLATYEHISNVSKLERTRLSFNMCPVCCEYWFGKFDSFSLHCEGEVHKSFLEKEDDEVSRMKIVPNFQDLFNDLNGLVHSLLKESNLANSDKYRELEILIALEDTVRNSYPKAQAYGFGSRIALVETAESNINIFLDCENQNYLSSSTEAKIRTYLANVCKDLRNKADIWTVTEIMAETKIPTIKLVHEPPGSVCELQFWNGISIEKSKLVGCYNAASPLCRQLILYLKNWLKSCRCLSGSDSLVTQVISWYVIFYLQVEGILPAVFELMKGCSESKIINGWECGYTKDIPIVSQNLDFKHHLQRFFSYYSDFDYQSSVACPYLGRLIRKHEFAFTNQLPAEMGIYKFRASANASEIFRFESPMCIQDPIDLSQNMAEYICKAELRLFRQYCYESAEILSLVN